MILLDSDHISVLKYPRSERAVRLAERLSESGEIIRTSVITVEEPKRGWLAAIAKERLPGRQVRTYRELAALLLTANRQDFEQIPGLRFENWLDA